MGKMLGERSGRMVTDGGTVLQPAPSGDVIPEIYGRAIFFL